MQITMDKLAEISGLSKAVCRTYMDSWRLAKFLKMKFVKRGKIRRKINVIEMNDKFIKSFAGYMKLKLYDSTDFIHKAEELLQKASKK